MTTIVHQSLHIDLRNFNTRYLYYKRYIYFKTILPPSHKNYKFCLQLPFCFFMGITLTKEKKRLAFDSSIKIVYRLLQNCGRNLTQGFSKTFISEFPPPYTHTLPVKMANSTTSYYFISLYFFLMR